VKERRWTAKTKTKRKDVYSREYSLNNAAGLPGTDEREHDAAVGMLIPAVRFVARERRSPDLYQAVHAILNDTHGWRVTVLESAVHLQALLTNFIFGGPHD
jgi:hypothetical protein